MSRTLLFQCQAWYLAIGTFIPLDPFCTAPGELPSRQLGKPWLHLDCGFPFHIGQKYAEKESTRSDMTVLRKGSSWINSSTRKLLDYLHGLVLLSKPKIQFYLSCLAGSRVHKTGWNSKCEYNEIFNPSPLFSHCLGFLSVFQKKWIFFQFFPRKPVNSYHFLLQEGLKNLASEHCHLMACCTWAKTYPCTSQKQNPWKEQL